jgi:hypothetical protein
MRMIEVSIHSTITTVVRGDEEGERVLVMWSVFYVSPPEGDD